MRSLRLLIALATAASLLGAGCGLGGSEVKLEAGSTNGSSFGKRQTIELAGQRVQAIVLPYRQDKRASVEQSIRNAGEDTVVIAKIETFTLENHLFGIDKVTWRQRPGAGGNGDMRWKPLRRVELAAGDEVEVKFTGTFGGCANYEPGSAVTDTDMFVKSDSGQVYPVPMSVPVSIKAPDQCREPRPDRPE